MHHPLTRLLLPLLLLASTLATSSAHAADPVPYGSYREWTLERPAGHNVLAIDMWMQANKRRFETRAVILTLNGVVVSPDRLLSPKVYRTPRLHVYQNDRMSSETNAIAVPWIENHRGLDDYELGVDGLEYDRWVKQYNDFPTLLCFSLNDLPAPTDRLVVRLYNTLGWGYGKDDTGALLGPPLQVESLQCLAAKPDADDFGAYVPPLWKWLALDPDIAARAAAYRDDPTGKPALRAATWLQFGILAQIRGERERAVAAYRAALAFGDVYAGYRETQYRLLILGEDPGALPAWTPTDTPDLYNAWTAAAHAWRDAKAGKTHADNPRVLPVTSTAGDWLPLDHQINGPEGAVSGNRYRIHYTAAALVVELDGPAAPSLESGDFPGIDRPVWEFNCGELFISPQARILEYFELNASAGGGRYDANYHWNGFREDEFDGTWTNDVTIADGRFQLRWTVPWSDLRQPGPPAKGEVWAVNIVRVQHLPGEGDAVKGKWVETEFTAAPLLWRSFHRLQDGLMLRFD